MKYYVINLERRPDRKADVTQKLRNAGFGDSDVCFFSAIDGRTLVVDPFTRHIFHGNTFNSYAGIIGCALSHFYIILEFLRSDDANCVIFEDDIDFLPHATPSTIERIPAVVPAFDIFFIGYHTKTQYNLPESGMLGFTPFVAGKYLGGTFAYMLSRTGAEKIYREIVLHGMPEAIDGFYKRLLGDGVLVGYEIGPRIVTSQWVDSEISPDVDSDIQRDPTRLPC